MGTLIYLMDFEFPDGTGVELCQQILEFDSGGCPGDIVLCNVCGVAICSGLTKQVNNNN